MAVTTSLAMVSAVSLIAFSSRMKVTALMAV